MHNHRQQTQTWKILRWKNSKVLQKWSSKRQASSFASWHPRLHTAFSLESAAKIDPGFFQHILLSPIQNAGRRCVRRQITLASPCAKWCHFAVAAVALACLAGQLSQRRGALGGTWSLLHSCVHQKNEFMVTVAIVVTVVTTSQTLRSAKQLCDQASGMYSYDFRCIVTWLMRCKGCKGIRRCFCYIELWLWCWPSQDL